MYISQHGVRSHDLEAGPEQLRKGGPMKEKGKAMVLASLAADSLSLGVHWIYDTERIRQEFGRVDSLLKPSPDSYHLSKERGDFTHYGDQTFVLLESVASKRGFEAEDFSQRWKDLFNHYAGYYDKATKATLENLSMGKAAEDAGSSSSDLAGASRIAPLIYCYREDLDTLVKASRAQTKMTHSNPLVVESAEFFARLSWMVLNGSSPLPAIEEIAARRFQKSPISEWIESGIATAKDDSVPTIARFGQSCDVREAFPGVIHLIARYEKDLKEALIQAVMSGGDSAGRGMIVGMVLGAHVGEAGIPQDWVSQLKRKEEISRLLDKVP